MPRFYFDLSDGSIEPDPTGTELPGVAEARFHAVRYAGEVLQTEPHRLETQDLRVEVSDQDRLLLFTIIVIAVDSAAAKHRAVANA